MTKRGRKIDWQSRQKAREGDSLVKGAAATPMAGQPVAAPVPSWWKPPTRYCVRGHDMYATGAYFQMTQAADRKKYRTRRCRLCRIEDVQNCRDRAADAGSMAGWW